MGALLQGPERAMGLGNVWQLAKGMRKARFVGLAKRASRKDMILLVTPVQSNTINWRVRT